MLQELVNTSVTALLYLIAFIVQLSIFSTPQYPYIRDRNITAGVSVHQTTLLIMNVEQKAGISGHSKLINGVPLVNCVCIYVRACMRAYATAHVCWGTVVMNW